MNTLSLVDQCYNSLPEAMKSAPWSYTNHGKKVLQTKSELNAYIAAYGEMHIVKCRAALQNLPIEQLKELSFEIIDWGCGQGLATLTLIEMLRERNLLDNLRKIWLIEPSQQAINRASYWVRNSISPSISVITINKYIPQSNTESVFSELSCSCPICINLFSNILDIPTLSLSWLAQKTSSLAGINYMICVGPKFSESFNTRIVDFCGYFNVDNYFSCIDKYPYSYTSKTKHAFGCQTRCFVYKNSDLLNLNYQECATDYHDYDEYDYVSEALSSVLDNESLKFYQKLRQTCESSYEIFFRPAIGSDTVDFLLLSKNKGVVLINICNELTNLETEYKRIETVKSNLFNVYLRTIKIDSIIYPTVYNSVKTALFFSASTKLEIEQYLSDLIEKKKDSSVNINYSNKNPFSFLLKLTNETDLNDELNNIFAYGFKYEYYSELSDLISSKWHSYKEGNKTFRLTNNQKELVRSSQKRIRVKGSAGCGKTQVVANRAVEQHIKTGDKVLIITFNIALIQYIKMRIGQVPADFSPNMFEITNYHQFFKAKANQYSDGGISLQDFDDAHFFDPYRSKIEKYKSILIDEVQDFKESWIQSIVHNFLAVDGYVSLFGDGAQNIYDRVFEAETKMPQVGGCGFVGQWKLLKESISMRILNPKIGSMSSRFAYSYISRDSAQIIPQSSLSFEQNYIKYWWVQNVANPATLAGNIKWIINNYNLKTKDVVVLGQSINLLRDVEDAYKKGTNLKTMITFETAEQYSEVTKKSSATYIKKNLEEIRRAAKTHFTTDCDEIKIATIHSFKGWESKTIILILQPEMNSDETFEGYRINDKENSPALIYTAITRARENIFILNTGNPIYHSFFNSYNA